MLKNKLPELQTLLSLETYDIIVVTETWLDDTLTDAMLGGQKFVVIRNDRGDRAGGVMFMIRNNIKFAQVVIAPVFS